MKEVSDSIFCARIADELKGARSVVDLGGDGGAFIRKLQESAPEKTYVLVEQKVQAVAQDALARIVETHPEVFVVDDRNAYDAVICRKAMEKIGDVKTFFSGVYDRLRPGGKFVLIDSSQSSGWKNAYTLCPERVDAMLADIGFSVEKSQMASLLFVIGTKEIRKSDLSSFFVA